MIQSVVVTFVIANVIYLFGYREFRFPHTTTMDLLGNSAKNYVSEATA